MLHILYAAVFMCRIATDFYDNEFEDNLKHLDCCSKKSREKRSSSAMQNTKRRSIIVYASDSGYFIAFMKA
jgi:hypothetical protein